MRAADIELLRHQAFAKLKPICVQAMHPIAFSAVKRDADNPLVKLEAAISELASGPQPTAVLDGLCEYICFPLLQLIKYPSPSLTAVESALLCFNRLLQGCSPDFVPLALYRELLVGLPFLISSGKIGHVADKRTRGPSPPEELKLAAVQCLAELLRRVQVPHRAQKTRANERDRSAEIATYKRLDRPEYQPTLAHIVVVLLDVIESERNIDLQCLALKALSDIVARVHEPDYVAQFLPGVSSTLVKVIVRDEKQSHRIIVGCLETLAAVVIVVLHDDACTHLVAKDATEWADLKRAAERSDHKAGEAGSFSAKAEPIREESHRSAPPTIVRDEEWHKSAVVRLNRLFANSFTVRNHENWRVRHAFLMFSANIIRNCSRSLADSIPLLMETLVGYVNDEYPQVADTCREQLKTVISRNQFSLNSMLKENFYTLMMSLPQRMMQSDDAKKLAALQIAIGYMLLLKDGIRSSLNAVIDKLSIGLLRIWTFDYSNVKLVEDRTSGGSLSLLAGAASAPAAAHGVSSTSASRAEEASHFPRHRYQYFHDERVKSALCQVCRLLGYYGNAAYLTDHFLGYVTNDASIDFQAQAIKITNEICLGAAGLGIHAGADGMDAPSRSEDAARASAIVKAVAREYLQSPLWNEPTSLADVVLLSDLQRPDARRPPLGASSSWTLADTAANNSSTTGPKLADFSAAICKTSLLLEGSAIQSRILGSDFEVLLMDALYLILEKAADSSRAVSSSAMAALQIVATSCGHPKSNTFKARPHGAVVELIVDNIDYLVNVVSRRLRYIASNPKAPLVLKTAIRIAGVHILPFMDDSVDEITDALDEWHLANERLVIDLVAVLQELIEAMNKGAIASGPARANTPSAEGVGSTASETARPTNPEFAGCSDEMVAFYLKFGPAGASRKPEPATVMEKKPKIDEIEKYFMDRAKVDAEAPDPDDLEGNVEPVPLPAGNDDQDKGSSSRDKKPEPPTPAQALALKVLDKVFYLLSAPDSRLRTRCLRIVAATLPCLATRPTDLNPAIHRFWPVIIRRLGDTEHYVAAEALALVAVVCDLSPEFVVKRVADDLIPRFTALVKSVQRATRSSDVGLRRAAAAGGGGGGGGPAGAGVHSRLFTSAQVKVQLVTLTTVATLLRRVPLSSAVLRTLVDRVVPFLNTAWYDASIVDAAVDVLVAIANNRDSADIVWLAVWAAVGAKRIEDIPGRGEPKWLRPCRMPPWMVEHAAAPRDHIGQFLTAGVRVLKAISPNERAVRIGADGWIETDHPPIWVK
ncbi:TEL2-interacting protein 1 [Geranomyces variabilis]|uniref:TEL2-interacting protein 1 n=1 Tax=Geranomyces variabilis TaxID=109894 RepID=A0AAD5TLX2_9FUNG|nr:TEL2-interacting protein 1 [Geranomyces variabilis]